MQQVLCGQDLITIRNFVHTPMFLFNGIRQLSLNEAADLLVLPTHALCPVYAANRNESSVNIDHTLHSGSGNPQTLQIVARQVTYKGTVYFLAEITDISAQIRAIKSAHRAAKARELMLEISEKLTQIDTTEHIYSYIMENALKAIKKSNLSSIFRLENGSFHAVACTGFDENIFDVSFIPENTFLYMGTNGGMDRTANIGDLSIYYDKYYPIVISGGKKVMLRSTLSTPLYVDGHMFGMINIDSIESNAFDEDDVQLMDFIRSCVETTLTNRILYEEKIYLSYHDQLTGLYNRAYFEEYYSSLSEAGRENAWLVLFDLNNLKKLNDSYGHIFGDQAIIGFAEQIKNIMQSDEVLARIGGDELIGLFYASGLKELDSRIMKIACALRDKPLLFGNAQCALSFSYGCADLSCDGNDFIQLFSAADIRMYACKRCSKENGNG